MSWLKNVMIHHLDVEALDGERLAQRLGEKVFKPCEPRQAQAQGWVSAVPGWQERVHHGMGAMLVRQMTEKKSVPASVVREHMDERVAKWREQNPERMMSRAEKSALKEQITLDLLPQAFPKRQAVQAVLDPTTGTAFIGVGSPAKADAFNGMLVEALSEMATLRPADLVLSPQAVMSNWMRNKDLPECFKAGARCVLKDRDGKGSIVYKGQDLVNDEQLQRYLEEPRVVTEIELEYEDKMRFTLTDTLCLKSIKPLDILRDEVEQSSVDEASREDATFAIHLGALRELCAALETAFGGRNR